MAMNETSGFGALSVIGNSTGLVVVVIVVALVLIVAGLGTGSRETTSAKPASIRAKRLITAAERQFLETLEQALPDCRVYVQVAMGALLDPVKGLEPRERLRVRGRFAQKIIDYVIEDRKSGEVVALVELDDRTHRADRDQARDAMTAEAGFRTIRFHRDRWPTPETVRAAIYPHDKFTGDNHVATA